MSRLIVLVATLAGCALTARLGLWQLDRAAQKLALQQNIEAMAKLPALDNAALLRTSSSERLHRQVMLTGRWLSDATVYLDNRPMDGHAGFFVVTPLQLEGRAELILVQRGWLPRDMQDRSRLPPLETPAGTVSVQGLLLAAPSRLFEFSPAASGPIRQNLDPGAYAREIRQPLLPLTVQQTGPADALKRDWAAPDLGLQKHYGYAFQWFALCALILGLYVWYQFFKRPA